MSDRRASAKAEGAREQRAGKPTANPTRVTVQHGDPHDQEWDEIGEEVRDAVEQGDPAPDGARR